MNQQHDDRKAVTELLKQRQAQQTQLDELVADYYGIDKILTRTRAMLETCGSADVSVSPVGGGGEDVPSR